MSQHIGPRTISAIGGSVKRVGNYRVHTFPSELVTDGLVLNLDAGDPRSYPSSGTTWTDLSGNGNNGTLVNGPTYNNADGGALIFDGSTEFVSFSFAPDTVNTGYTIGAWFRATSFGTNAQGLVSYGNETTSQRRALFLWDGGSSGIVRLTSSTYGSNILGSTTLALNTWYYGVVTVLSTGECKIYLNGVLDGSGTNTLVSPTSNTLYVGKTGSSEYFNGKISFTHIYNRALSAAEVAQNYDALRVRYGAYTNTFTPICGGGEGKVEVLCVAGGGGGGGGDVGSGGGAGGLIYNSAFTINSNSPVSLSVGAGGKGNNVPSQRGANGSNSTFSTLTAVGGGGGNGWGLTTGGSAGGSGGSGGGGRPGGSATSGQGYPGGSDNALASPNYPQGGGGGAGGPGQDGYQLSGDGTEVAGDGGPGLQYSISGESKFYAGGGGGGIESNQNSGRPFGKGGSGVGGDGGRGLPSVVATNGIPNTGSGGGGDDSGTSIGGGNGANGIVIVRYPATDYNVEVLVVGGGGGGGGNTGDGWNAGGGGAGGLIYYSSYPVSAGTKYSITVGAGGTAGTSTATNNGSTTTQGSNGGNSVFGSLVSFGGGGGGASSGLSGGLGTKNNGLNGGSGGGGAAAYNVGGAPSSGGIGVSGQGNSGAQGSNTGSGYSGGGGGAGGTGTGPGAHNINNYGPGLTFSITGSSVSYAQGGQGGRSIPASGAANSGTGGDGAYSPVNTLTNSASGGSGIIIIAYKGPQRGIGGTIDTTSRPGYTLHKFTTTGTDFFIP